MKARQLLNMICDHNGGEEYHCTHCCPGNCEMHKSKQEKGFWNCSRCDAPNDHEHESCQSCGKERKDDPCKDYPSGEPKAQSQNSTPNFIPPSSPPPFNETPENHQLSDDLPGSY